GVSGAGTSCSGRGAGGRFAGRGGKRPAGVARLRARIGGTRLDAGALRLRNLAEVDRGNRRFLPDPGVLEVAGAAGADRPGGRGVGQSGGSGFQTLKALRACSARPAGATIEG